MTFCPEAIIFDMDGLLVDSEPVWDLTERAVIEARGIKHNREMQLNAGLVGLRMDEFWAKMVQLYELTDPIPDLIAEIIDRMINIIPMDVKPNPGAAELIARFQSRGVPMAIASSSPLVIIEAVIEAQGWQTAFPIRVSGDEVARGKPAPDVYLEAARRLEVEPSEILTLEDSVNGARAAVSAGMICYAVPDRSHTDPEYFAQITPHVFDNLFDVLEHVRACCP